MRVVDQASIVWETLERAAAFVPLINDFLLSFDADRTSAMTHSRTAKLLISGDGFGCTDYSDAREPRSDRKWNSQKHCTEFA